MYPLIHSTTWVQFLRLELHGELMHSHRSTACCFERQLTVLLVSLLSCACLRAPVEVRTARVVEQSNAIKSLFARMYVSIERGDAEGAAEGLSVDALVFGLGPLDTWQGRKAVAEGLALLLRGPKGTSNFGLKLQHSNVVVGLTEGENSAWAFDIPLVSIAERSRAMWLPRLTAHLIREGDRWFIDALHVSLPVPDAMVMAPDASKKITPPMGVVKEQNSESVIELTTRSLQDYETKLRMTSPRAEFIQVGTSPAEIFIGGKAFQSQVEPMLPEIKKAEYSWKVEGDIQARLAPDGKSAWAAAVVVQRQRTGRKQQLLPPFRFLWAWVKEGNEWHISAEHQSVPVDLSLRLAATEEQLKAWQARLGNADIKGW